MYRGKQCEDRERRWASTSHGPPEAARARKESWNKFSLKGLRRNQLYRYLELELPASRT